MLGNSIAEGFIHDVLDIKCKRRKALKMERILNILGTLDMGGAETMVINMLREGLPIDIAVCIPDIGFYEQTAILNGAKVYHLPRRRDGIRKHHKELKEIIKGHYNTVHIHTQNAFLAYLQAKTARSAGATKIIVHSHNTMDWRNKKLLFLHRLFQRELFNIADVRLACSTEAAEWLFGTTEGVEIMPLPINCSLFKKDAKKRALMRCRLGIPDDEKVIICVGRFSDVKNQGFLINVMHYLEAKNSKDEYRLILVGDGENKKKVKEKAQMYEVYDKIKFTGIVNDVYDYLNASDVFVLPSFYEGFPTVILEAVASGLPCVISDTVSKDMDKFKVVCKLSLDDGPRAWADFIDMLDLDDKDIIESEDMIRNEYDAKVIAERMNRLYVQN